MTGLVTVVDRNDGDSSANRVPAAAAAVAASDTVSRLDAVYVCCEFSLTSSSSVCGRCRFHF